MTQIVQAECPGCKKILRIATELLGQPLRCKHCRLIFQATANTTVVTGTGVGEVGPPVCASEFVSHQSGRRTGAELWFSFVAIGIITAVYVFIAQAGIPKPSSALGHGMGIAGFLLMASTETLYSLRKRVRGFNRGRMSIWLQMHIVTGLIGSFLVLLHSAGKFNGLAGILSLLTIVAVVSGFVGRYIYTALPRTLEGVETGLRDLSAPAARTVQVQSEIDALAVKRRLLALWYLFHIPLSVVLFLLAFIHIAAALYYATFLK